MAAILALTRICVTFELPSRQVFFYELVGPETLPNAIALNSGLFNATRVIGPALAGVCLTYLGATGCFALNGLSYLAAIVAVLSIRLERPERSQPHANFTLREVLGGLHYLKHDRRMLSFFLLVTFFGVVGMGYEAMMPAYTRRIAKAGVEGYSILLACGGVGATLGAVFVASLGKQRRKDRWAIDGHAHLRRIPGRSGLPPDLGRLAGYEQPPAGSGGGLSARYGLWRRGLLCLGHDDRPARLARSSPRPDHGHRGIEVLITPGSRSTFYVNATGWSRGLEVTGGGSGVVSHAGLALLRHLSDKTGLTSGLSQALPSPLWGHDRGRVVSDLACAIADGARVISDFRVMGDQRELFGQVASVPTAWRSLKEIAGAGTGRGAGSPPR